MPETLPRTGPDQLHYWLNRGAGKFVYVIKAKGESPIKVGKAIDVVDRMAQLQTGNPRPLELLQVLVGYSELEWQLHRKLRRSRLVGEWFDGDEIRPFMVFVEDLAERMLLQPEDSLPDWRDFGEWQKRKEARIEAPIKTSFVQPQEPRREAIQRPEPEIGWVDGCPLCRCQLESTMEPDLLQSAWEPGVAMCVARHTWTYSETKRKTKRRRAEFYLIGPA